MEIIKQIENGMYAISSYGKVISNISKKTLLVDTSNGYARVTINKKRYFVHRLVLSNFNPSADNKLIINHIDGDKLNNKLDNLEWVTARENTSHGYILVGNKSSKHIGVHYRADSKKWRASIRINKKLIDLGTFKNESDASLAYINYINKNNISNKYAQ